MTPEAIAALRGWIGRSETRTERVAPEKVAAMAATLDRVRAPGPGERLPHGWHWMFFQQAVGARDIGPDGHPKRGGFLPPVPLPRRMWAGGRLIFHRPLIVDLPARRESIVADVTHKQGRSGELVFVVVRHRIFAGDMLAIEEEHDIAYRPMPGSGEAAPSPVVPPAAPQWRREIGPDPVLLFRYSALTFNGHRIHYDRPYATEVEGYPGLVVHGPLIATLLLELTAASAPDAAVSRFAFRAVAPLFDTAPFAVNGAPEMRAGRWGAKLWAETPAGGLAMSASAE